MSDTVLENASLYLCSSPLYFFDFLLFHCLFINHFFFFNNLYQYHGQRSKVTNSNIYIYLGKSQLLAYKLDFVLKSKAIYVLLVNCYALPHGSLILIPIYMLA